MMYIMSLYFQFQFFVYFIIWGEYPSTLYAEQILNKIAKTFDGTYAGLKSMLQRFRIYFFRNPAMKGMESTS